MALFSSLRQYLIIAVFKLQEKLYHKILGNLWGDLGRVLGTSDCELLPQIGKRKALYFGKMHLKTPIPMNLKGILAIWQNLIMPEGRII